MPKKLEAVQARIEVGRSTISFLQSKIHNLSKMITREMTVVEAEGYRIGDWEYKQKIEGYTSEIAAALDYIQLEKWSMRRSKKERSKEHGFGRGLRTDKTPID